MQSNKWDIWVQSYKYDKDVYPTHIILNFLNTGIIITFYQVNKPMQWRFHQNQFYKVKLALLVAFIIFVISVLKLVWYVYVRVTLW